MKKFFLILLFFITIFYISIGSLIKLRYQNLDSDNLISKIVNFAPVNIFFKIIDNDLNILRKIESLYYFNPSLFSNNKTDLIFDLSKNDRLYNDSIINKAINNHIVFEDHLKKWRKSKLIYDDKIYNVKYKFHGSALTPYKRGLVSLKVKTNNNIFGYKKFNLVTSEEFDYKSIFLNYFAKENGLISEDKGKIVSAMFDNKINDYFIYQTFDKTYFDQNYPYDFLYSFRKMTSSDNWRFQTHASDFDQLYYNLDNTLNHISDKIFNIKFNDYKKLNINEYVPDNFETNYYGKFLSLIYLFGHPHQITGDNEKWIATKNYLLPLYRNEGHFDRYVRPNETFDSDIFSIYAESKSLEKYLYFLTDDHIRNARNNNFFKLVKNKNQIIKLFDSIYKENEFIHKRFNERFLKIKYENERFRKNLITNIESIEKYLNASIIHTIKENDTLRLQSNSFVKLQIRVNNQDYYFYPKKFNVDNGKLTYSLNEFKIFFPKKIESLRVFNAVTKDEIDSVNINLHNVL